MKCKDVQDCSYALSCVTPRHFPGENEQRHATPQNSWCPVRDAITESAECMSQALKGKLSCLMYVRVFFLGGGGCLNDKRPPDVSRVLCHTRDVGTVGKGSEKFSVIITCRKINKNSPLLQSQIPRWTASVSVQLYFKQDTAGKCSRKYLSSGDKYFEEVSTNFVTTVTL
jgi:hypothetical protein